MAIVALAAFLTCWMSGIGLEEKDYLGHAINVWIGAGGLVSAAFVVYGYLINLSAFTESQKPKLLIRVMNGQKTLLSSGALVHETQLHYANIGSVECNQLSISVELVKDEDHIEIPRLFQKSIDLQIGDSRVRSFPTEVYLEENGVPKAVIRNIHLYTLVIKCKLNSLGKLITRSYEYEWSSEAKQWVIS